MSYKSANTRIRNDSCVAYWLSRPLFVIVLCSCHFGLLIIFSATFHKSCVKKKQEGMPVKITSCSIQYPRYVITPKYLVKIRKQRFQVDRNTEQGTQVEQRPRQNPKSENEAVDHHCLRPRMNLSLVTLYPTFAFLPGFYSSSKLELKRTHTV